MPAALRAIASRQIGSVADEARQTDRKPLDQLVFDALVLSSREREAVYEVVIELVEWRLSNADGVR